MLSYLRTQISQGLPEAYSITRLANVSPYVRKCKLACGKDLSSFDARLSTSYQPFFTWMRNDRAMMSAIYQTNELEMQDGPAQGQSR